MTPLVALILLLAAFAALWTFALLRLLGQQDAERRPCVHDWKRVLVMYDRPGRPPGNCWSDYCENCKQYRPIGGGEVQGMGATVVDSTATHESERGTLAAVLLHDELRIGGCG